MTARLKGYLVAIAAVAAATFVCFAIYPVFGLTNLVMVYLLATLLVATQGHRGPAALSSILSVLAFDFSFVPPRFSFTISDMQYVWTFVVMFITAMVISHLTIRMREEGHVARQEKERSIWLMEKAKKAEIEAESERLRSSLLSSVSHDLRTPLAAILGSASALVEKPAIRKDTVSTELLENIQSETERLSHLVQNILDATRLEAGKAQLRKERYPLEEIVGDVLERLKTTLKNREVVVTIPETMPAIPMDGLLIEQLLINLLENAVRHAPASSRIDISAQVKGNQLEVSVADQGPGLKADELEKVFDKFYHSPESPGAGLGLMICRAIADAHGGRIWAANRPEGGAVFTFRLPI